MNETDLYREELVTYYSQADYTGLIAYCTQKLQEGQSTYLLYGARGKAYLELEEYPNAIDDLTQSLRLNKTYSLSYYNRGICYWYTNQYTLAINDLEALSEFGAEYRVDFFLSLCYYYQKQYKKAIDLFSIILATGGPNAYILEHRASAYSITGMPQLATRDYMDLLNLQVDTIPELEQINAPQVMLQKLAESEKLWAGFTELSFLSQPGVSLTGIYILEFTNQEFYVGQAKNIHHRLKQHRKAYHDIQRVYVKSVPFQGLLDEENATIAHMQQIGLRIRNLKQLNFLTLFDNYHQRQWINQLDYIYISGTKYDNQVVREQFAGQFKTLQGKPYVNELIRFLATYVNATIPNYLASEFNYWSITCLPKYLKEEKFVSRINIHAVPVLSVYEEDDGSLGVMLFVSKLPILNHLKDGGSLAVLLEQLPSLQIDFRDAFESQTQGDELTLFLNQADIEKALLIPVIRASCRVFNLRMMNRTGTEVAHRRTVWHYLDLADSIHQAIRSTQESLEEA